MSTINTALSILCSTLIKCVCIRSYNKPFRKPQTRPSNFLALIEIASGSNWLIFLFVIKPGYLPEQPGSHGPGEKAAHLFGVLSRWDNWAEADQVRFSPFQTWVNRGEDRRKKRGADRKPNTRWEVVEMEPKSITRGNMHLHIVWRKCRPMSN